VKVVIRNFEPTGADKLPFYEAPWFAMVVRNGAALLAVLLVLLIGVRPLVKAIRGDRTPPAKRGKAKSIAHIMGPDEDDEEEVRTGLVGRMLGSPASRSAASENTIDMDIDVTRSDLLTRQVDLAQRLVAEKPESAVAALRQMINEPAEDAQTKAA